MSVEPDINIYNPELELVLIGCILINPGIFSECSISADDFFVECNAEIWRVMQKLHREGKLIDILLVREELDKKGIDYGGLAYLGSATSNIPTTWNAPAYAKGIVELAVRRRYLDIASKLAKIVYDLKNDLAHEIPIIIDKMVMLSAHGGSSVEAGTFLAGLLKEFNERIANPTDIWGMRTSFQDFDKATGGLQKGESMILSGDSGVGKSMLGAQIALQLALNGYPGVIYSLEMRGISIMRRLISGLSKVRTWSIKTGLATEGDIQEIYNAADIIDRLSKEGKLFICDTGDMSLSDMRSDIAKRKCKNDVCWFLLDYLYLLSDNNGLSENEGTTLISRGIKNICYTLDVAGISIHSMNKGGMDKSKPVKSDLRGSGQLVYDADVIAMISQDDYDKRLLHWHFKKLRDNEQSTSSFDLMRGGDGKLPYFVSVTKKKECINF